MNKAQYGIQQIKEAVACEDEVAYTVDGVINKDHLVALEELAELSVAGLVENIRVYELGDNITFGECPACHKIVEFDGEKKFCPYCRKALKWKQQDE